jgi:hypothetical protein
MTFTSMTFTTGEPAIVCTLGTGSDMAVRMTEWRAVLAHATGRERTDRGVAATFGHDVARTAELARLLAAEYACCSFATYRLTIDGSGVRMEIEAPPAARAALAAAFDEVGR